jgi:hypothetical protein
MWDLHLETVLETLLSDLLSREFRRLFEEKHLYQNLDVTANDELLGQAISRLPPGIPAAAMLETGRGGGTLHPSLPDTSGKLAAARLAAANILSTWGWGPLSIGGSQQEPTAAARAGEKALSFTVDTVETHCSRCDKESPFNFVSLREILASHPKERGGLGPPRTMIQAFTFNFQCQSCKGLPEVFLVHRIGSKIILSGRAPIEKVCVPRFIPKASGGYYSDAIVATQSGKTLAGLFFLRVLIEQFVYSAPDTTELLTDQAIDRYMASLPVDFKDNFPSLKDVYRRLSEALHRAKADDALFRESLDDIECHFDARRVRRLPDWGTGQR